MANQRSRGGQKQGDERHTGGKQHQGVREGSTGRRKERHQKEPRRPIIGTAERPSESAALLNARIDGNTRILVAEGSRARLFAGHVDGWTLVRTYEHPETRLLGKEVEEGGFEGRNSHRDEKERFAGELVADLDASLNRQEFEQVVIVAEPEFLGIIRGKLDSNLSKRVLASVGKELHDSSVRELQRRIQSELRESIEHESRSAEDSSYILPNVMRPAQSDGELALRVHEVLSHNPALEAAQIEVTVDHCRVTLQGTAPNEDASALAETTAAAVPRVAQVDNHLSVQS
jgi:protein required for attachment to host cells